MTGGFYFRNMVSYNISYVTLGEIISSSDQLCGLSDYAQEFFWIK